MGVEFAYACCAVVPGKSYARRILYYSLTHPLRSQLSILALQEA